MSSQGRRIVGRWFTVVMMAAGGGSSLPGQMYQLEIATRPQPVASCTNVDTGDFNENGHLDIVIGSSGPHVVVYPDPDLSGFTAPPVFLPAPSYQGGVQVRAGYFNADAHLDVMTLSGVNIHVLFGTGNGGFSTPLLNPVNLGLINGLPPVYIPLRVRVADFNQDGLDDVLAEMQDQVTGLSDELRVVLNGTPQWGVSWSLPLVDYITDLQVGDINGDGAVDICWIAVSSSLPTSYTLNVVLGDGAGMFSAPYPFAISLPSASGILNNLKVQDLDGDGYGDVTFLADAYAPQFRIFYGNPITVCDAEVSMSWPGFVSSLSPILWVDVDADGDRDFVCNWCPGCPAVPFPGTGGYLTMGLGVLTCTGYRSYSQTVRQDVLASTVGIGHSWAAADFDGDGDTDLVAFPQGWPEALFIRNRALLGSGCVGGAGAPPGISVGNTTLGNSSFALGLNGAQPSSLSVLGVSTGSNPLVGCGIYIDVAPGALLLPLGNIGITVADSLGVASIGLPIPSIPSLSGVTLFAQWITADPLGAFSIGGATWATSAARTMIFW